MNRALLLSKALSKKRSLIISKDYNEIVILIKILRKAVPAFKLVKQESKVITKNSVLYFSTKNNPKIFCTNYDAIFLNDVPRSILPAGYRYETL